MSAHQSQADPLQSLGELSDVRSMLQALVNALQESLLRHKDFEEKIREEFKDKLAETRDEMVDCVNGKLEAVKSSVLEAVDPQGGCQISFERRRLFWRR